MAFVSVKNVKIAGISACVPEKVEVNQDSKLVPKDELDKFIQLTGVEHRHCVSPGICTSDLCLKAAEKLIEDLKWDKSEIDLLIFVSHTTDYRLPSTACILQDKLKLPTSCMAFDVTLGCSGFIYGCGIAGKLLTGSIKKALLMVGNTQSVLMSPEDKSTYLLFGDAGTVTALEQVEEGEGDEFDFHYMTDGSGAKSVIIPDGGCRNPVTFESFTIHEYEGGIRRNGLQYHMDGVEVFSCAVNAVPKSVQALCEHYHIDAELFDYILLHQANKFMCEKIRKKLKLPSEKVPYNIQEFGNTSGATIPLLMVTNLREELKIKHLNLLLATIGVGFSYGSGRIRTKGNIHCSELMIL